MGLKGKLPFAPRQIGGWWQANREVDLVLLGETQALLAECKWSSRPVGIDILRDLEAKAGEVMREAGMENAAYALCSRSGFTDELIDFARERKTVYLYDWKDMVIERGR